MAPARLSALDASFLAVESACAHMHVGWVAVFEPPADRPAPTFAECRDHIAARLHRAPRFRQVLSPPPLGFGSSIWVDDPSFNVARHVTRSRARELTGAIDWFVSKPLRRDRPLWHIAVADQLADGRFAVIGKAHHCMVDGIAAVELASLLVDPDPDPPALEPDTWAPRLAPRGAARLADAVGQVTRRQLDLAAIPARVARSPRLAVALAERVERATRALVDAARPARGSSLNRRISPARHLARLNRPIDDLIQIKRAFGVKLNDVILAVCAGGVRDLLRDHGERPIRLKTMVPVNVRGDAPSGELGNQISFMFVDLPCDEPDALRRLREIHMATTERKRAHKPEGGADVMRSLAFVPGPVQRVISRLVASPRAFNLTVSNIPGPPEPLYMLGCRLVEAYPVVPIADGHAVSIGVTTVADGAHFGIYVDPEALPDADALATAIDRSIDELLAAESFAPAAAPILD